MEQSFGFAGRSGGGGILDVAAHVELDEIMSEFPFAPFSNIPVIPLTDVHAAIGRGKQVMARMMPTGNQG